MFRYSRRKVDESQKSLQLVKNLLTGSPCINISGDHTWNTRGHTSRIGVCEIIGDKSAK